MANFKENYIRTLHTLRNTENLFHALDLLEAQITFLLAGPRSGVCASMAQNIQTDMNQYIKDTKESKEPVGKKLSGIPGRYKKYYKSALSARRQHNSFSRRGL